MNIALLFFASYVLTCSINPLVDKLSTKMKRGTATTLTISGITIIIFAFFLPLLNAARIQIDNLVQNFPQRMVGVNDFFNNSSFLGHKIADMIDFNALAGSTNQMFSGVVNQSINATIGVGQFLIIVLAI